MEDSFCTRASALRFAPDAEIGIEVDPRVTNRAHLETLRRLGFNRLSMGIQDFQPKVQETIHRVQPYEMTRDLIAVGRELGFESLNVDLIYGLPYQTAESFQHTIEQVLTLAPDRVAMFSYAHVPWLKKQQGAFQAHLPEGKEKFRIFRAGLERFLDAGYLYIGMDHFARPGDELAIAQQNRTLHRNFQGYTTKAGADLYGMGVSAISSIGEAYAQNRREVPAYQDTVASRGIATMRGYRLSADDVIRRAVIGRLLCHTVIPKREIERDFSISFDEYFAAELDRLEEPRAEGLVELAPAKSASRRSGASSFATWPWCLTGICTNSRWTSGRCSQKLSKRTHEMAETNNVAVIGGGISGLACAYRLRQLGLPVTLLEAEERAGGLIGTVRERWLPFRIGPAELSGHRSSCWT